MAQTNDNVTAGRALIEQVWHENPIFRQVLGICSALAVTNRMFNTLLMCGGLIWATTMSSLTVSLLRNYTPTRIRMMVQVLIISVYVICVDIFLRAMYPEIQREIAAYVGLIITNCIVMGRLEAFASKNPPLPAVADGLGAGLGYSFVLLLVATIREILGFGTLFGVELGGLTQWWQANDYQWVIMIMPPGAFFVLAVIVWIFRSISLRREAALEAAGGGK